MEVAHISRFGSDLVIRFDTHMRRARAKKRTSAALIRLLVLHGDTETFIMHRLRVGLLVNSNDGGSPTETRATEFHRRLDRGGCGVVNATHARVAPTCSCIQ